MADFLLRYRTTPHSTTGIIPAELMTKQQLRTRLSLIHPSANVSATVEKKQGQQKAQFDGVNTERAFSVGDVVRV
jgi:orotate phosphoribosyltransferase-like protein